MRYPIGQMYTLLGGPTSVSEHGAESGRGRALLGTRTGPSARPAALFLSGEPESSLLPN